MVLRASQTGPLIALKARPTPRQLADRLSDPRPEALEIYLDADDIRADDWLSPIVDRIEAHHLPADLALLVEGPVRSLDGSFFDLSRNSEANRLVVERLTCFGNRIGARAACIHLIVPTDDLSPVAPSEMEAALDRCVPLTTYYVERCREAGLAATVENVPPVGRMREGRFMTSPVGTAPEHLAWLGDRVEDLRFTFDTSHAQLFLNGVADPPAEVRPLLESLAAATSVRTIGEFVERLSQRVATAHVSDADGLLGEGLPYGQGTMDLDGAVDLLLDEARWLVAEILEPDPDQSPNMRSAAARMAERRARRVGV